MVLRPKLLREVSNVVCGRSCVRVGDGRSCGGGRVEWKSRGSCGGNVVWGRVCVRLHKGGSVSGGGSGCVWEECGG